VLFRSKLWETSNGKELRTFQKKYVFGFLQVVFSPNGKYVLAGCPDKTMTLWDVSSGKNIMTFYGHTDWVTSVAFSPDGKYALSGSSDNTVKLWDVLSGQEIRTFQGQAQVLKVIFNHDGRYVLSSDSGGAITLWDSATGSELAKMISFDDGEWIVITPEGYYNSSENGDKHLNVRIGNNVYGIDQYRETFYRPDIVKLALAGGTLKDFRKLADIKQPPSVTFVNTPSNITSGYAIVNLKLVDMGGGIGDVRLYLNGSAVMLDNGRGVKIVEKDEKAVYKNYAIKLTNGLNTIRAIAFNADNTMQSSDVVHELTASFKSITKPSLYALVIGIKDFKNPKLNLTYTIADAELFARTLQNGASGLFENVNIKKLTTREETTNENIMKELRSYKSLNPDDIFVFFVASHGKVDDGEYFLITSNVGSLRTEKLRTDAITQTSLKELIANIPATKKLILLDTCNAGALGDAIQIAMMTRGMSEDTAMKVLSRAVGSTILSASTSVQEAIEGYQGHGLFTYVLSEGLTGKADKSKSGYIKTTELADYVDSEVPPLAEKIFKRAQYPTISISGMGFPIVMAR
jgi:WD40 repeat protein